MKHGKPDWWELAEVLVLMIGGGFWWAILILMLTEGFTWRI